MAKLIRCECGFVARGASDDEVIGAIRGHLASDHPALLDSVSHEDNRGVDPGGIGACPSPVVDDRNVGRQGSANVATRTPS